MNFTYSNDINNYYLHITGLDDSCLDDFRVKMLLHNKLTGFIPLNITYTNNQPEYTYNITGLTTIEEACSTKKLTLENFMTMLGSLDNLLSLADKYLLNPNNFIFIMDYIYINPESYKLSVCYCPFHSVDFQESFYDFICFLLDHINYEDKELVDKIYKLQKECLKNQMPIKLIINGILEEINDLNELSQLTEFNEKKNDDDKKSQDNLKPCKLNKNLMNDIEKKKLSLNLILPYVKLSFGSILLYFILIFLQLKFNLLSITMLFLLIPVLISIICYSIIKIIKLRERYYEIPLLSNLIQKNEDDKKSMLQPVESTPPIDETEENSFLSEPASNNQLSKLIPEDKVHFDTIPVTTNPFTIGKISGNTDGYIFSPLVSRVHARITCDDEKYFIKDLNSDGGTYINEEKMEPDTLYPLKSGDKISFSTIKYTFLCI